MGKHNRSSSHPGRRQQRKADCVACGAPVTGPLFMCPDCAGAQPPRHAAPGPPDKVAAVSLAPGRHRKDGGSR